MLGKGKDLKSKEFYMVAKYKVGTTQATHEVGLADALNQFYRENPLADIMDLKTHAIEVNNGMHLYVLVTYQEPPKPPPSRIQRKE